MKRLILVAMILGATSVAGCETLRGAGQDLANVGNALVGG